MSTFPSIERLTPTPEPAEAFRRFAALPHAVFFDSALSHQTLGRYSFLCADPFAWHTSPADGSNALASLETTLGQFRTQTVNNLPPFQGGLAGMFGYEMGHSLERVPAAKYDEFQLPALAYGLYDVVLAWDHLRGEAWLISQGFPETEPSKRLSRATQRLAFFHHLLSEPVTAHPRADLSGESIKIEALAPQFPVGNHTQVTSNFSREDYLAAVQKVIDYIHAGDVFQVNLSQRLLHRAVDSAVDLYLRLRERNAATFAGYLDGGRWQIASASPERFFSVRDGEVETRPIKGTRRRIRRPESDLFTADELKSSEKDRAENVMIVDLLRNDLSRVCQPDSVQVTALCGLEVYETVQHLVSVIQGRLADHCNVVDLLRASFPGGSITGAPKVRAMEIIAELEPTARGAYCGSLGYIGFDGTADLNILIRTVTAAGRWWQFPVGGGIVAQSDPFREYEETWHKAAGVLQALS